jgi:hypothetical protein
MKNTTVICTGESQQHARNDFLPVTVETSLINALPFRISPLNEKAQTDFLQALSMAGFDNILDSIGNYFDFEGLACYSLTFIAVSSCQEGFLHYDTHKTSDDHELSRAFNIIIPLLLSNDTEPELNVASSIDGMIGRLRYQYDFAVMVGFWDRFPLMTLSDLASTTNPHFVFFKDGRQCASCNIRCFLQGSSSTRCNSVYCRYWRG